MSRSGGGKPVFDATAVLALLQDEPGAEVLRKMQPEAIVNAVNIAEVLAKLVSRGMPAHEAQAAFDALHLDLAPFEPDMAGVSAHFVHKNVSLGDRCFLAAAQRYGSGWTSDRALSAFAGKVHSLNFFR